MSRKFVSRLSFVLVMAVAIGMLAGCAASSYISYKSSPDYPKNKTESLNMPGLSAPVMVYFDEAGIPHIKAENQQDLLRATGFVQARQRYFAMDVMRRFARGRVSELVGEQEIMASTTIQFDLSMRGWGFDQAAPKDVAGIDPEERKLLEGYVEGINYALTLYKPLEYRLLRVDPEPWTLADSFALGRLTAWAITQNWHQEASRLLLALNVGTERGEKIYGNDYWHGGMSLPPMDVDFPLANAIAPELHEILKPREYDPEEHKMHAWYGLANDLVKRTGASNAWVVGPEKSESGMPIVANDPHMAHLLPSMFYQQHISAPGLNVIGATVAGLPYVLTGHNENVAWGTTSAVGDVTDLYIEKVNPENPLEYLTSKGYKKFIVEEQLIRVRDGKKLIDKKMNIRRTIHGPVLNDMYPNMFPEWAPVVTVKWDMRGGNKSLTAFGKANLAKTVYELRDELKKTPIPSSLWVAGDTNGDTAIFTTGFIPVRENHLGTFPVPGWLDKYEWAGMIDPDKTPHAFNSPKGYFAHGNNLMRDPAKTDVFYCIDSAPSYRVDRISEMLEAKEKHNFESFRDIQKDVKVLRGQSLAPYMLEDLSKVNDFTAQEKAAYEILKNWDYVAGKESGGAALFFVTYRKAIMAALQDEVDPKGFEFILAQRYSTNVADLWFHNADHVVWDFRGTKEKAENRYDVVVKAFKDAVKMLNDQQGSDTAKWQWGKLHDIHLKHLFGGKKVLAKFVNFPKVAVGGGLDSVWKSHFDLGHPKYPYRAMAGPSYREIIDLADLDHAHWVVETGASAWPGDPHYGDQHELWKKAEYVPMYFNWDEIVELSTKAGSILTLTGQSVK